MPELAFVGLGSNLGDRLAWLTAAAAALADQSAVEVLATSSVYASAPVGLADQPEYLNAVAAVRCGLDAGGLLAALLRTEAAHQRRRDQRWGPRTVDLDLLLFGEQRLATAALTVPHPRLHERAFVLVPLLELAPDLRHPGTGLPLRRHLAVCDRRPYLRRLGPLRD